MQSQDDDLSGAMKRNRHAVVEVSSSDNDDDFAPTKLKSKKVAIVLRKNSVNKSSDVSDNDSRRSSKRSTSIKLFTKKPRASKHGTDKIPPDADGGKPDKPKAKLKLKSRAAKKDKLVLSDLDDSLLVPSASSSKLQTSSGSAKVRNTRRSSKLKTTRESEDPDDSLLVDVVKRKRRIPAKLKDSNYIGMLSVTRNTEKVATPKTRTPKHQVTGYLATPQDTETSAKVAESPAKVADSPSNLIESPILPDEPQPAGEETSESGLGYSFCYICRKNITSYTKEKRSAHVNQ